MAMMLRPFTLACVFSLAGAFTFTDVGEVSAHDAEAALLLELEGAAGPSVNKDRLDKLEAALRPMYASFPKNQDGNLDHDVVRYALHRLLVKQHGWYMLGLEPSRTDTANASNAESLSGQIPSVLQSLIERRVHNDVHLRHLAVLAATLEDLVRKEAVSRLEAVYTALSIPPTKILDTNQSTEVIDTYMFAILLAGKIKSMSTVDFRTRRLAFVQVCETKPVGSCGAWKWWRDVLSQKGGRAYEDGEFSFATAAKVVEHLGENFGAFNDGECAELKNQMLSFESPKPGRVRLSEFYNHSRHSHWQFTEKVDYLRALGALDESNPQQLHVIVPNYVMSRPNCLNSSHLFETCCRNECEDLMSHLEQNIVGPTAPVSRIAALVANLPSATVTAPRALSPALSRRLNEIAEGNRGRVPLHGRLFAQWMHHAFPRECPFPHTDATNPQTPDEWMATNGHLGTQASEEEMTHVCVAASGEVYIDTDVPWIEEERLLVSQPVPIQSPSQTTMPEQSRSQALSTSNSSISSQNFVLFFFVAMLFVTLAFALTRGPSVTHGFEKISKKAQTDEVSWRESAQAAFAAMV